MWTDLYEKIRQFYRATLKPSWKTMLASKSTYLPLALTFVLLDVLFCLPFFIQSSTAALATELTGAYANALHVSGESFSAVLRHLSAGGDMLLLLGLCLWLPVCLFVLSIVFRTEVDAGKFVHGLYITFGADTKRLQSLLCLQFVSLGVVLTLPSWILTGMLTTLFYAVAGFTCRWHLGSFWLSLLAMPLLTWLCIGIQASRLVRVPPVKLLSAANVADVVSSPRKSTDVSGKYQSWRLALLGIFRMRRYYLPLILICSLCASSALGLFATGLGTLDEATAVPAFTYVANDGMNPESESTLVAQLSSVSGVADVVVPTTENAADVGTHLLFFEGQTDGIGDVDAGAYESFQNVTLRIADEITNEALDFAYSPVAQGNVTLMMPTSGSSVALNLSVGDRIIVCGRTENGNDGTTLRTLTVSFIRRGNFDGVTLLLNASDYAVLAPEDTVSFYTSDALLKTTVPSDGIVLALPADAADTFAVGETVTLQRVRYSEKRSYENGALNKFVSSAEVVLHGTPTENGLSVTECLQTTVSAIIPYDGGTAGYLFYDPAQSTFSSFGPNVTGVTGVLELKMTDGGLYALHTDTFAVVFDGDVPVEQSLSLPSYPDPKEVSSIRVLAAANPNAYAGVNVDTPNEEYNHVRYFVTDTFSLDGQTIAVGFRRQSGSDAALNPFTPILTYGTSYVMLSGSGATVTGATMLLTDDEVKNHKKTVSFGSLSANNNWLLTADDTITPGNAVLELPQSSAWNFSEGDVLHIARAQQVSLKKYVEDIAMLTDPTVLLETQLQYVSYLYDNYTLSAVTTATGDVPVIHVCAADAAKLCGRSWFVSSLVVYVDKSVTPEDLADVTDVLEKNVKANTGPNGEALSSFGAQAAVWNLKVWYNGGFLCGTLCHGLTLVGLLPLIWLFTQNGHYKKRKDDLDLLFGIGKSDAEIATLLRYEAGICGLLTAMTTAFLIYPVCFVYEKMLSLPDVPLSTVRVGSLPFVAVVLIAGAAAMIVTYHCARRASPAAQKGGVVRGNS